MRFGGVMAEIHNAQPSVRRRTSKQWTDFYHSKHGKVSNPRIMDPETVMKKLDSLSEFVNRQGE